VFLFFRYPPQFSLRLTAEDERFELSEGFTPRRFSKPLVSATHPILHLFTFAEPQGFGVKFLSSPCLTARAGSLRTSSPDSATSLAKLVLYTASVFRIPAPSRKTYLQNTSMFYSLFCGAAGIRTLEGFDTLPP